MIVIPNNIQTGMILLAFGILPAILGYGVIFLLVTGKFRKSR